ncbi:transposase [Polaromonas naphthalenivorans]|uniref:Transposase IS3/IS911 family protein n=1 Tax=Polaromonas naphthalenivorans (strain CJ2) TaxID=365044 RepID=A1VJB8_POLNA|nr:transposase [Polaromonas naphthalenivorans]ABM35746.1 transposase IS3/IS911 family protein [Polaromonas naphthalenivorans CJ2]
MLKNSETSRYSTRRTHRTYTAQFKAELVAACGQLGVSIAALAGQHAMNANVLHRWLKEHHRSGRHQLAVHSPAAAAAPETASPLVAFIPLQLPAPAQQPETREIKVELRRGALSMVVTWPVSAAAELASWTAALVK